MNIEDINRDQWNQAIKAIQVQLETCLRRSLDESLKRLEPGEDLKIGFRVKVTNPINPDDVEVSLEVSSALKQSSKIKLEDFGQAGLL